jgi:pyrroline-5-carboxylate reductase
MFDNKRIAVLGVGKLGEALITGMVDANVVSRKQFIATAAHQERLDQVRAKLEVETTLSNAEAVEKAHLVLLCVKPQTVEEVLRQIAADLTPDHIVVSVAASVTTKFMEAIIGKPVPVIRTMPNTPCFVKKGMTAIAPGKYATPDHVAQARKIFDAIGRTLSLDEKHMDAVTGLSASGPAFVYIIIESFIEAGVKVGLPRDAATQLAAQMVLGASTMVLETGEHPAKLKDIVTTPAGCTVDGILELEDGGLRVTLIKAVVRATQRAKELVNG